MDRIVIIGTTGSGKSTLAEQIAQRMAVPCVELDSLHWEANWQQASTDVFRERVVKATAPERWVVGGNYSKARDLIWTRADTLIWLDYTFPLVISRLFWRTVRRIVTQEDLWGTGNRETWQKQFLSRDSLFIWAIKTHGKYRQSIQQILTQPEYAHLHLLHFISPRETSQWLKAL
ncbi:MAG: AAA family ATPase [Chloroflexi bacterium]|nr:AAA family ATPase [Chloroflexota bacterium]